MTSDVERQSKLNRDEDNVEVDVVIENAAGQLVGVEVKAAAMVKKGKLRELRNLSN